ncbi:hypothetical protein [Methylobacterium sp. Leaf465]|uniref:hypothetical protein n=1 Tax=Methylobacterium sp. Leaf465 TaxID=1736385 RepID=UPI0012E350AF|nr:hypothetical protein [Methylobacterium sp. Leaf465]
MASFYGLGDIRVATQVVLFVERGLRLLLRPTITLPSPVIIVVPATGLAIPIFIVSATPLVTLAIVVAAAAFTRSIIVIVIVIVPAITTAVALAIASTAIIPLVVAVVTTPSLS